MHNHHVSPQIDMKNINKKAMTKRLLGSFKPYTIAIISIMILALIGTLMSVMSPKVLGDITNQIQNDIASGSAINLTAIGKLGIILVSLYVVGFVFKFLQKYIVSNITMKVTRDFRTDISRKINRLPLSYFDNTSYGDVLSRITNDVDTIANTLSTMATEVVSLATMLIGTLIMMFVVSPYLALIVLLFVPISIVISVIVIKKTQPMYRKQQDTLGTINGNIEEIYSGLEVVKAYGAEEDVKATFDEINDTLYHYASKAQFYSKLLEPIMNLIGNIAIVTIIVVGALLTLNGTIGIGDIQSMCMYMMMFNQPITQISQMFSGFQVAMAATQRVYEFLDEAEMPQDNTTHTLSVNDVVGNVTFDHVSFGYDKNVPIIKDFSAHVRSGQKIAIVGPTGAGKTTLVNLLMRFYDIDSGSISIDGYDTSTLSRANVHDLFCMVLQDTWIFHGTLRENIVYSKQGVSDEELDRVCALAGIDSFVDTLPNGYDTVLDDSLSLSVGQRQLITIARAMIENAPMLILDEATSSVDTRTEILIQDAMDKLTHGRTSFIIAHRLSTIKNADLILVLKDGDIIEQGTHSELLAKGGAYSELYMSQFAH